MLGWLYTVVSGSFQGNYFTIFCWIFYCPTFVSQKNRPLVVHALENIPTLYDLCNILGNKMECFNASKKTIFFFGQNNWIIE